MINVEPALKDLQTDSDFLPRHIGPRPEQIEEMLATLSAKSLDALIDRIVPDKIRSKQPLDLPVGRGERDALSYLRKVAGRNQLFTSMIGMGYYGTVMPKVVLRRVMENPGWYTAYTPYQAEISQGRLEALLNFQQMVMDLTGFDLANASLLDEATAAAEAMTMAKRVSKSPSNTFFVDRDTHPQTVSVIRTRADVLGYQVVVGDPVTDLENAEPFAALLSYPGSSGRIQDLASLIAAVHEAKALAIVATDLLALTLLTPPGELGADMAIGSAQRFGVPMGYGGPHAAFFATHDKHKRAIPGRIIGVSKDALGNPAFRMALQTREQHIRRDKATSNICTAQALLAIIASFYAIHHGTEGLVKIAQRVHRLTRVLALGLTRLGYEVITDSFFDTITIRTPGQAARIAAKAREQRINIRVADAAPIGVSLDEATRQNEIERLWFCFDSKARDKISIEQLDREIERKIPGGLTRQSDFLTHPVFHLYHSETEMLRYMRRLQAKDIALDRSMIPLGSCTMKLNGATEMIPLSWRELSNIHPFVPLEQAQGYQQLFEELEAMLCEVTGFDAISLQPNAGSQGEYTGLLTIRRYHESRGEDRRRICLIPTSAHGTNPASAVMAGMEVVAVACDEAGNVDVEDLRGKAKAHADELAALMITYPSTHGVFEESIVEICRIVHEHGGQVYIDGANLNALLGIAKVAEIGGDVCHMNLHKTFCIPHGGGGPGVGPIGVRQHLAPFLPDHPIVDGVNPAAGGSNTVGAVAAAPWGSASILSISWAYIAMMGSDGLPLATKIAILNANYIAGRLKDHYPVVYTGPGGGVAHECILDLRHIHDQTGISVEDVAKRLIDYGYHAPTMSWPVPQTLMVEPTESEDKQELDRFCDAMIMIRKEIAEVEEGRADKVNNVVRGAPHMAHLLVDDWDRPYTREQAFFPLAYVREDKYWPPVARIDNVAGDRQLVCACPPMDAYMPAAAE
ncbi:MAG: aminomethyl-transferring glycine dehydrogenase [Geminicoccaceae bacterium]